MTMLTPLIQVNVAIQTTDFLFHGVIDVVIISRQCIDARCNVT